jgi:hypothetical protein
MSGFTENRTPGASERSGPPDRVLTWHASRAMLPLVGRIARDIMAHHERLAQLRPELAHLERHRHTLDWPQRRRRYHLEEEVLALEKSLRSVIGELEALGVALLDPATGLVGFPTRVNDRSAYFSWKPGEEGLLTWNYAGDLVRRSVPEEWTQTPRPRARSRSNKKG